MNKNNIHRAGRKPINRPNDFYNTLMQQYEHMTTRQLAEVYHVTPTTISNWLKIARTQGDEHGRRTTEES